MQPPKSMIPGMLMIAALLSGILTAGCGREAQTQPPPPSAPEVATVTVGTRSLMLTTRLPGRTSACRTAEIRPQVNGLIQKRLFEEGAEVKAGQVLYQIEPASFQAAVDSAAANRLAARKAVDQARAALKASEADVDRLQVTLDLARTNQQRYTASYEDKIVSAIQLDQAVTEVKAAEASLRAAEALVESNRGAIATAEAAIQQAEAALKTARINLGYCRVTAPISGRIGRSSVTEGAVVTAYQPVSLATIQQLDPIYVDVPQSTTELLRLKRSGLNQAGAGQNEVELILEDGHPYPLKGTLQFSESTVDATTGSVILRAVFPNPDYVLLPNMFVQTRIREGVNENAILVPQQGVTRDRRGNPLALVVDAESKAALRMLNVDRAVGDQWLVASGLVPGDRVIVEGLTMLRPGTSVKAVSFQKDKSKMAAAAHPAGKAN